MRYSNRFFLYAPFVILLGIAAIAMFRWHSLAQEWEANLRAADSGHEIAPGVTLHFASEEITGFPFNLDVVLHHLVVAAQSSHGPISLESEQFAVHALTYGRTQQIFESAGTQVLTWTDAEGGTHRFAFVPGSMRASAIETNGRLTRLDIDIDGFGSRALTGGRAQFHLRNAAARDAMDFAIRADGLRASSGAAVPHVDVEGQMTRAASLSPLMAARDEWRNALARWRSGGGALRLDRADIALNASHIAGSGTLALDESNRLSGEINLQLSGEQQRKPMRLVANAFTSAIQDIAGTLRQPASSPIPLWLDIHNGAATVSTAETTRSAGVIGPMF